MTGDWRALAACRGMNTDLFFPEQGDPLTLPRLVCAGCPVRVECRDYAVMAYEPFGVWGGTSERERRRIRRHDQREAS